jgi:hypothetical protein
MSTNRPVSFEASVIRMRIKDSVASSHRYVTIAGAEWQFFNLWILDVLLF